MLRVTRICALSKDDLSDLIAEARGLDIAQTPKMTQGINYHAFILRNNRESIPANYEVIHFQDFRTKQAQMQRDEALAKGRLPILEKALDDMLKVINYLKPALYDLFPNSAEFEIEKSGYLNDLEMVGHIDCLSAGRVIDLKVSYVGANFDKHIYDMRYQLQLFLYMKLTETEEADLVFLNPNTLSLCVKTFKLGEIAPECEALLKRAIKNYDFIESIKDKPLIHKSAYNTPQWAFNQLEKDTNELY